MDAYVGRARKRVAIIGAGLAGLALALMLGRRGHQVILIEKDADELKDAPSGAWRRSGVGQAAQTHSFLARSSGVLQEELPDVLADLLKCGVGDCINLTSHSAPGNLAAPPIAARRLAYERVFRRKVAVEPNISLLLGGRAVGFLADVRQDCPHVSGLWLEGPEGGRQPINADLVVDASGRRSQVARLLAVLGCRPPIEEVQKCDFRYLTRWYRSTARSSAQLKAPLRGRISFGGYLLCPADDGHLSLSLFMSEQDEFRHFLRQGEAFDRFVSTIPSIAPIIASADATDEPQPFAGIENRRRSLVDEAGPIVTGFILVGDSAMYTNPTLGRGTSLAFMQAQFVARRIDQATSDPRLFCTDYERWIRQELGMWFDTQLAADSEICARLRALAGGTPLPPLSRQMADALALQALAQSDAEIADAWHRQFNMLVDPVEVYASAPVREKIDAFIAAFPDSLSKFEGPTRESLMDLLFARA